MPTTAKTDLSGFESTASTTPDIDKETHRRNLRNAQNALSAEFQALVSDTENLLKQTSEVAGVQVQELRARISNNIDRAKVVLKDTEQTLGVAAGVGFLLGLLSGRR